ncbi:MAG TPA: biotin carboxylase N-terminal domain-containing protein [Candidatus Saccharimonadales bacterium]|nr:biotin carboxylase N-terminal domain-containing protein [Candidatus Saccharimonadales bacterium]
MMTVLVANRGEIARRIFRTAKRMDLRTVAVYSDADADSPFVREADTAIRIGPAPARDSYLNVASVIAAARESEARLIHPGYGFLSEQAAFAKACAAAGVTFVGPSPEVLSRLGDKAEAKAAAERAGVPVIPGYRGADQKDGAFASAARTVGYPVMLKPAAGGGGIGMQLVANDANLRDALARARRTARAAFGDERLILERAIERPRHVEIQLLADAHGTVLVLGERDCSAQRRHQKVIEETPSPAVDATLRARMNDAAIALAKAVGYVNAGTCEFIVDQNGDFFFLEVNARLQVEHPVTELVWGVDLVEQQLRIAMGERLHIDATPRGHAVEARLYAEDPASGFLPSTGRIALLQWPDGPRIDSGIEEGSAVTADYDPLLAKVVVHAADRRSALDALGAALRGSTVFGVRTNERFLRNLVADPVMRAGGVDTGLIERTPELVQGPGETPAQARALAAAAFAASTVLAIDPRDPWRALAGWRAGGPATMTVLLDDRPVGLRGSGPYTVDEHTIVAGESAGRWAVDGEEGIAARDGTDIWVKWRGETYVLDTAGRQRSVDALAGTEITAPMPGVVLAVHARAGDRLKRGDLVCVVEAMKMELRVEAPGDGTVTKVLCAAGDQVKRGQRLAEFEGA